MPVTEFFGNATISGQNIFGCVYLYLLTVYLLTVNVIALNTVPPGTGEKVTVYMNAPEIWVCYVKKEFAESNAHGPCVTSEEC